MGYEVLSDYAHSAGRHECDLPNPCDFAYGTVIKCTEPLVWFTSIPMKCGRRYRREATLFRHRPVWRREGDW